MREKTHYEVVAVSFLMGMISGRGGGEAAQGGSVVAHVLPKDHGPSGYEDVDITRKANCLSIRKSQPCRFFRVDPVTKEFREKLYGAFESEYKTAREQKDPPKKDPEQSKKQEKTASRKEKTVKEPAMAR